MFMVAYVKSNTSKKKIHFYFYFSLSWFYIIEMSFNLSTSSNLFLWFKPTDHLPNIIIKLLELFKITEALIVNGVIIANGVADSDGDVLTKKDIKTIFMKYQRDTDTMHTSIKNAGVEVFASWISEIDTSIGGKVVPSGSWLATLKVTNEKLIQCIKEGKLNGFSLGSVSEKAFTPQYWFINKSLNYRDIKDIEEVIPLYISFVDKPANQYQWEVMTYDAYINKNEKLDVEDMTEKEDMIPVSFVEKLMDKLSINKSETKETEEIEKAEEEPVTSEPTADETVTALFEKLDTIIEQNNQILEGLNKTEDEVTEDEEVEKAEDTEEENSTEKSEEEKEEEVEKAEETEEETETKNSEEETSKEKEEEDDVRVDKRETSMVENQTTSKHETFNQRTNRDAFGRKIKA